jgi:hypothetical protein
MSKQFQDKSVWTRNNPLFLYGSKEKLNDLVGRAFGRVVTQFQESQKRGGKGALKLAAKLGGFLASLGLGEASSELTAEISEERTRTVIAQQTFERKLNAVMAYCRENEPYPYIDSFRGLILTQDAKKLAGEWAGRAIAQTDRVDCVGMLLGLYTPRRVVPPTPGSIVDDFMNQTKTLWLFESIPESKCTAQVPVLMSNTRALLAFAHSMSGNFKIETVDLCAWNGEAVTCDPLGWRLFH